MVEFASVSAGVSSARSGVPSSLSGFGFFQCVAVCSRSEVRCVVAAGRFGAPLGVWTAPLAHDRALVRLARSGVRFSALASRSSFCSSGSLQSRPAAS